MENNSVLNIPFITDDMIKNIKIFKDVMENKQINNIDELYETINSEKELLKLLIEEIVKKTSTDAIYTIYQSFYDIFIPYIRDTLSIDNIKFELTDINENHMILLNVFIEDTYYGMLNIFDRTYELPNVHRMLEIEKEAVKITEEINKKNEELTSIALKIKYPKKYITKDRNLKVGYIFNKKSVINKLKTDFFVLDNDVQTLNNKLTALNNEYATYQQLIMNNRSYENKLNERLTDRLRIEVDDSFKNLSPIDSLESQNV